jgi:hypothetical protein
MLKKLIAAVNPFVARKPMPVKNDNVVSPEHAGHSHSFSCACKPCSDHTAALTRARLKRQGA